MAITQISRIQHRRGLQQDLPQLASAELGWSIDTRKLYIGNGTLEEGAPVVGITEILTSQSDLTSLLTTYTFKGESAGYAAQTGPSVLSPITRSFNQKWDDFVNVKDFGAVGNGIDDDTNAINRAIQQIYKTGISEINATARRTLYFPGGKYLISNTILIPPYARIVGEGINSTIIQQTLGNKFTVNVCDSKFQTGASLGSGSAVLPDSILIENIQFINANSSVAHPVLVLDSASNVRIVNTSFKSNLGSSYSNIINVSSSVRPVKKILFDSCQFMNGSNGISLSEATVESFHIINSLYSNIANVAIDLADSTKGSGINNIYNNVGSVYKSVGATSYTALAEDYPNSISSLRLGNLSLGVASAVSLSTSPTIIASLLANSSGSFTYEIINNGNRRFGTFDFVSNGSATNYTDNYVETTVSLNGNLTANGNSLVCSLDSGTAIFKYNLTTFV